MTDDIITPEVDSGSQHTTITDEGRLAIATAIGRDVESVRKQLHDKCGEKLCDEHATSGTLDKELRVGDTVVGKISYRHGKRKLAVINEPVAMQWAYENGYLIQSIDFDALERHIHLEKDDLLVTDDGVIVDGIAYMSGADYVTVTGCKDDDIAAALAALPGGVGADPLALLEGGDDDAPER